MVCWQSGDGWLLYVSYFMFIHNGAGLQYMLKYVDVYQDVCHHSGTISGAQESDKHSNYDWELIYVLDWHLYS